MHVLMLLRDLGLDPASDQARRAVGLVRDGVTWKGCGPQECDGNPFFAGEVEPCINGQVGAVGAYFGQDIRGIVDRLLAEQLPDGGPGTARPRPARRGRRSTRRSACSIPVSPRTLARNARREQPGGDRGPSPVARPAVRLSVSRRCPRL